MDDQPTPPQSAQDEPTQAVAIKPAAPLKKSRKEPPAKSRLSKKMRQALELWISGAFPTQRALALHCNIDETWISKVLARDDITAFILARTRQKIAHHAPVARQVLADVLMQTESQSARKDAATYMLGVSGIAPPRGPGITINNNVAVGYDIEPFKGKTIDDV